MGCAGGGRSIVGWLRGVRIGAWVVVHRVLGLLVLHLVLDRGSAHGGGTSDLAWAEAGEGGCGSWSGGMGSGGIGAGGRAWWEGGV